jgi:NAD(P)H-hydrate epimerase
VLTPHLKEMSGICGHSIKELKTDRFRCFQEFTETTPSVCVMKDARTLVGKKGCPVYVNTSGNQAMAKGGAGDVLGGVIAGLLAQGMKPYEAGVLGVFLHGLAGDDAQRRKGSYSVLASDILEGIAEVLGEESREAVF